MVDVTAHTRSLKAEGIVMQALTINDRVTRSKVDVSVRQYPL
jgi:hypothetical protein